MTDVARPFVVAAARWQYEVSAQSIVRKLLTAYQVHLLMGTLPALIPNLITTSWPLF